jgi:hypothetical protein
VKPNHAGDVEQPEDDREVQSHSRSPARTEQKNRLHVYMSDKDWRMIDRLRRDLDCGQSDLVRAALRDLWLKIHGRPFR